MVLKVVFKLPGEDSKTYHKRWHKANPPDKDKQRAQSRKRWAKMSPEVRKLKGQKSQLWQKYRLRIEEFDAMALAQNYKCAICNGPSHDGKALHVDHDHETGRVRGLLCGICNSALGWYERMQQRHLLYKVDLYLTEPKEENDNDK